MINQPKSKPTEIGEIPEGWEEKELSALGQIITGKTPPTVDKDNFGDEYPFITPRDMKDQKYVESTERYLSEKGKNEVGSCLVPGGTICVSCIGSDMGKIIMTTRPSITNQQLNSIVPQNINPDFVYYAVAGITNQMRDDAFHSTAVPILNKSSFARFKILVPKNKGEADRIAKILSDLDDKIELNRQMNKTLESIAQTIFKQWFVDFEFPHEYGESENWKEVSLGTLVNFVKGRKPPQTYSDNIPGTLPQILIEVMDGVEPYFAYPESMIICGQNDVLMVMDGASSGRVEIGFSGIIGSTLAKIVCKTGKITTAYLYFYLKNKQKEIAENTTGSAIPHADRKRIEYMVVVLPSQKILEAFTSFTTTLFQQILKNNKQIKILSKIRDSLLPKLMSGKIGAGRITRKSNG